MCLGCRQRSQARGAAADLVRIVAVRGESGPVIVVDHTKSMPGRGAWLHARTECVSTVVRRKALPAALRVNGITVDPDGLVAAVMGSTQNEVRASEPEQVAEDMSTP
ncbi:YlxR family protein [Gordonia sp. TBRC 11910]|uniref:YlxR family protein n=1 Tax=Gordonia asplenii TaxID=2725283 RepID=A0A848KNM8_9ACTN|nr:YlxR family protein [Gordonia asplenii]NMN99831.1 YlxR family protein [Gordonia asplenii]